MSNQSPDSRVHEQLARAVISGLLPDRAHEQAEKLLTRLETPVRLALIGMPQSGKSTILNLLIGQNVVDSHAPLPTFEFVYGRTAQAICTLSDGTKAALEGVDMNEIAQLSPVFVEIRMPLPALKKISVLEVVGPTDPNALHRASQWAAKRCDIAIWCTGDFPVIEQRIWTQMPDPLKDHALLLITRKDLLEQQGTLEDVHASVRSSAAGEFNKIIPISARDAIAARAPDGAVDKERLRQSGGMALISAVLKQVDQGRRSALDLAEVLLLQNEEALADLDAVLAAGEEEEDWGVPQDDLATSETDTDTEELSEDLALDDAADDEGWDEEDEESISIAGPEDETTLRLEPALAPDPLTKLRTPTMSPLSRREGREQPPAQGQEAEKVSMGIARLRNIAARRAEEGLQIAPAVDVLPETRKAYEHALSKIAANAAALSEELETLGDAAPAEVISRAVDDLNWLCDYLGTNGDNADPALQRARDTVFDAADMVQLMQLERQDSAAIEALSLLVQVTRELRADLAA